MKRTAADRKKAPESMKKRVRANEDTDTGTLVFYSKSARQEYRVLSNFFETPFSLATLNHCLAITAEHAYQSNKAWKMGLGGLALAIVEVLDPKEAKRLGGAAGASAWIFQRYLLGDQPDYAPPELVRQLKAASRGHKKIITAYVKQAFATAFPTTDALLDLMRDVLRQKFAQPAMRDALLATGDRALGEKRGRGGSGIWTIQEDGSPGALGTLLMERRAALRENKD